MSSAHPDSSSAENGPPGRVAVVGAGMVGLATAWFLQEQGVEVTVLERDHVAAGASWGNAGWLPPSLTTPLPEPDVLKYGVRAVISPASPVYVPIRADLKLARFLAGFAKHSTSRQWGVGMRSYAPLNRRALDAFDLLSDGGVKAATMPATSFLACYQTADEAAHMVEELEQVGAAGQDVEYELLDGAAARALEPTLSDQVGAAVRVHGQRYINPPEYMDALADTVRGRGGELLEDVAVQDIHDVGVGVMVTTSAGESRRYDAVVIAAGAWFGALGRKFGVRRPVQAGRGYSFTVPVAQPPAGPIYLPTERIACTPLGERLRVAGMMEFRRPGDPLDPRRIQAIVEAARPMLAGADLDDRHDEWVGSRPVTSDGLPLIGPTRSPRVFAAGGHGMWGIALGPLTGQLLADAIVTGRTPLELTPFDPLR